MLKQELGLKQVQKLSPLQIQTIKLIELPIQDLEQRIRKELEENLHLCEGEEIKDSTKVSTDNATGQSILKYSFNEYGRWDVTCKIVYSPSSPNAVSFCGEASYTVQIVP